MNVLVLSSSIREHASTRRVALHLLEELEKSAHKNAALIDLVDYEFAIWKDVFHHQPSPPENLRFLHDQLEGADAMIFVTPEYNGSYSLALKNMVDYFGLKVFEKKAIGVSSISTGNLGGIRAALQLQQLILAVYALPVPQMLLVPSVQNRFDESGKLMDDSFSKNVDRFLNDFLWLAEALYEKKKVTAV